MNNYNYPAGADTKDAPWNQEVKPCREIEVTVSITLSKTVEIEVDDYTYEMDEDGTPYIDYSTCNLKRAVKDQVILPNEVWRYIEDKKLSTLLKGWDVDDFEAIKE